MSEKRSFHVAFVAALMLAYFGATVAFFAPLQNVLPRMIESVSSSPEKAVNLGLVTGLGALAAMISNPLSGYFSDRRASKDNRSLIVLAGLISGAFFLAILGQQNSLTGITVFWVLCQITINIAYSSMAASVVDHVPQGNWGTVWGLVGMAQSLALVGGFVVVTILFPATSSGMIGVSCIYALSLIPFTVVVWLLPRVTRPPASGGIKFVVLLAKSQSFGRVWLGKFLVMLATAIALLYLYYYLQDVIHYSRPGRGQLILVVLSTGATIVTAVAVGRFADLHGAYRRCAVVGTALMAVVTFVFAATGTWGLAIVGALVLGSGYGVFIAASQALSTLALPDPASAARDLGIMNIASTLPQTVGPPLAALVLFLGAGYRGLFACAGVMLLGAALVFSRIRARQS